MIIVVSSQGFLLRIRSDFTTAFIFLFFAVLQNVFIFLILIFFFMFVSDFKLSWQNARFAFTKINIVVISVVSAIVLQLLQFHFADYATLRGNMGDFVFFFEVFTEIVFSVLFGVNMGLFFFKFSITRKVSPNESFLSAVGSFLSLLITGCPACSITIASYLGLASVLATLPFFGYEVKVLGLLVLLYSTFYLAKNLTNCKIN